MTDLMMNVERERIETFTCFDCKGVFKVKRKGSTGYAVLREPEGEKVCFECCAKREWAQMKDTGLITLYLSRTQGLDCGCNGSMANQYRVSNWPSTLSFQVTAIKKGRHNIAGVRHDVWFMDKDGREWHGVNYGEHTQLTHCRRLAS